MRGIGIFLVINMMLMGITSAQELSVEEIFQQVVEQVEAGKSPGLIFLKIRRELDEMRFSGRDNLQGGLLLHYTSKRERAIFALEAFRREFPQEETPEILAVLIVDYALTGQMEKAETLDQLFREKYPDNRDTLRFDSVRLIDAVDHALLIVHSRSGQYEKAIAKASEMVRVRDSENPPNYRYNVTIFQLGSGAYIALGRYDEAIEFLAVERAKFEDGLIMAEYADLYKAQAEYEKILNQHGIKEALAHLAASRDKFKNKYVLRRYEAVLNYAGLIGQKMPELNISDWLHRDESVESLEGKVIILDFWATWCHACRDAFPHMNELYTEYEEAGLVIVGITKPYGYVATFDKRSIKNLEYEQELELTRQLVSDYEMKYQVIMDREGINFDDYKIAFLPTVVIIDRQGVIRKAGFPTDKQFDDLVIELLNKGKGSESQRNSGLESAFRGLESSSGVAISVTIEPVQMKPGDSGEIVISYLIPDGFHLTEDFFEQTVQAPNWLTIGKAQLPEPGTYEGEPAWYGAVDVILPIQISRDAPAGRTVFSVSASSQICSDSEGFCYPPYTENVSVELIIQTAS